MILIFKYWQIFQDLLQLCLDFLLTIYWPFLGSTDYFNIKPFGFSVISDKLGGCLKIYF